MSYFNEEKVTNLSTPSKIVEHLYQNFHPTLVIDNGYGLGAWLINFQEKGVSNIFGIDGVWIKEENL
ncbi:hypothetical protein [Cecembia lonarensis]|uniref:Uncharacterized protein n=1 Tax=Cecembia lonarensis (strain CCUG 58316 / KCTC 22772 / LW9) TaxID=1225176 RepID=K1L978_CECL9|nr:hypothetical protein [Cecembia lonarensis]EKB48712.1 hypothetical protein B879_02671 [Cecembia lonarensis LW9]